MLVLDVPGNKLKITLHLLFAIKTLRLVHKVTAGNT